MKLESKEAAAHCGFSVAYLHRLAHESRGPRYYQMVPNGKRLYDTEDLDAWMHRHLQGTADQRAGRR